MTKTKFPKTKNECLRELKKEAKNWLDCAERAGDLYRSTQENYYSKIEKRNLASYQELMGKANKLEEGICREKLEYLRNETKRFSSHSNNLRRLYESLNENDGAKKSTGKDYDIAYAKTNRYSNATKALSEHINNHWPVQKNEN